ncbi:MAG: hypothetical protein SFV54_05345 [Bryobacteraceae bacterium]|nr:hypothetical protein [Bryobacteraceae bacterium]
MFVLRRRALPLALPSLDRREAAAAALLLFALLSNWLLALKPEVSADGLAMHLVIPARVALDHQWTFDVSRFTWAVMPMGGDWAYTAAYLMAGEAAARLLNFGLLAWIAFLLVRLLSRWTSLAWALLLTAVFASSPLVAMVTGSMFVENFWCALVIAALSAVFERRFYAAALLLGAAVASKLGALAFAVAILVLLAVEALRLPGFPWFRTLAASLAIFAALASIPYATAWIVTGNPVFPFLNTTFKSPLYDTTTVFQDNRYKAPLSLSLFYDTVFHTRRYLESFNGGFAFHWLALVVVPLAALRRWTYPAAAAMLITLFCFFAVFSGQSYVRYVYPLLALALIPAAYIRGAAFALSLIALYALNLAFLPAPGGYHRDFTATPLPDERRVIDYMNSRPGAPGVAFLEGNAIGALRGSAVTNSWHSDRFWRALRNVRSADETFALLRKHRAEYVVAFNPESPATPSHTFASELLLRYTDPEFVAGRYYVGKLRSEPQTSLQRFTALPGAHEDSSGTVAYRGAWSRDTQFKEATGGTVTYSERPGDEFLIRFTGVRFTWFFTRASNRGRAQVFIDDQPRGEVNQFAADVQWQSSAVFDGLPPGPHTVRVRILEGFIDLDRFVVE